MEQSCFPRKSDYARKRTIKRSYTRKASLSRSFINMAEARREIVNALHLHRSSSSSPPSSSAVEIYNNPTILCSSSLNQNYYQQLTDSMPVPEPTWSTTAPAVLCAPVPSMEVLEVEWFDNVSSSSSYSWWIGFLNSLDGKREAVNGPVESPHLFGPCLDKKDVKRSATDVIDQSPSTDEWMVFPATDECGDQVY